MSNQSREYHTCLDDKPRVTGGLHSLACCVNAAQHGWGQEPRHGPRTNNSSDTGRIDTGFYPQGYTSTLEEGQQPGYMPSLIIVTWGGNVGIMTFVQAVQLDEYPQTITAIS